MTEVKWVKAVLIASYVFAFLVLVPFAALIGLILGIIALVKSEKKPAAIIAIALNIIMGFFSFLFTQAFLEVFLG